MILFVRQEHVLYILNTRSRPHHNGVSVTFKRKSTASLAIIYANQTSTEQPKHTAALEG